MAGEAYTRKPAHSVLVIIVAKALIKSFIAYVLKSKAHLKAMCMH